MHAILTKLEVDDAAGLCQQALELDFSNMDPTEALAIGRALQCAEMLLTLIANAMAGEAPGQPTFTPSVRLEATLG